MKIAIPFIALLLISQTIFAKKFQFRLVNTTASSIQVSAQIIRDIEKDNPDFLFVLQPNQAKDFEYKLKSGEKIKFIGLGGGIETLPLVKSYELLSSQSINEYQIVLPILDKLNVIELNDAIAKIKNDNILKILLDSSKYVKDELPPLGTFLFINNKDNTVLPLTAAFWRNESAIRKINSQYFNTTSFINSSNAASLSLSGVPFLSNLSTSFSNSNIMEVVWDIQNAHIQQWQPLDKNVFQILQDQANDPFIKSCVAEMKQKNLAGGDYQLLFISAAYVVDKIKISGRKYNGISFSADMDFQIPPGGVEVIQPIGLTASYKYTRAKTYMNVDSALNAYLRFLAQDYTPALNAYLTQQERTLQKNSAVAKLESLKTSIVQQYGALQTVDNTLINSTVVDVIVPMIFSTPELILKPELIDAANINSTPQADLEFNKRARQYNSILATLNENVTNYKLTLESIDKLNQQGVTDYQKITNLSTTIELEKRIIDKYIKSQSKAAD